MNWADYIVLGVIVVSVLVGLWRGLVSEVMALATWVAAFWVAWMFGPGVAARMSGVIDLPSARVLVAYGLCFLLVLVFGALLRFLVSRLVESTGLTGTDRVLGMGFGFARGVLLVTVAVFLLGFTPLPRDPWWQQSVLLQQAQGVADWLSRYLPDSVRRYVHPAPGPALVSGPARPMFMDVADAAGSQSSTAAVRSASMASRARPVETAARHPNSP